MDVTNTALLDGLKDAANRTVWADYVERYRPLIVGYARKLGAPPADAEDIAQSALLAFATAYREGRYDRGRGRLSSWLFGIVTNQVRAWSRRAYDGAPRVSDDGRALAELPADDELGKVWESQWRASLLRACLRLVASELQPQTMAAFEAFALQERPAEEVAAELGLTTNAVFGAKRRVLDRVRDLMPLMDDA